MRLRDYSFVNKFIFGFLLLFLCFAEVSAQKKPKSLNPLEGFLDTQFWLGLKMGMNYTQAFPETRYTGFSPIDYAADSLNKSYEDFNLPGAHMGLEMNFYHRGFSISFQPAYKRSRYTYSTELAWEGAQPNSRFQTRYTVEQKLDLIELPLMVKYDFIRKGKIRPFVMVGAYHSLIAGAQKEIKVTQTDFSSGTPLVSNGGGASVGVKDAFRSFSGLSGGVGVNLDYWNIRTVFEIGYKHSLTPATRENTRENEFASLGEVNDEIHIRDLNFSLAFVFPFRFIDQQFKAY